MRHFCDILVNFGEELHHIKVKESNGLFDASDNIIVGDVTNNLNPRFAVMFAMLYLYSPVFLSDREIILNAWKCSTSSWRDKRGSYRVALGILKQKLPSHYQLIKKTNAVKLEIHGTERE